VLSLGEMARVFSRPGIDIEKLIAVALDLMRSKCAGEAVLYGVHRPHRRVPDRKEIRRGRRGRRRRYQLYSPEVKDASRL